MNSPNPKPLSLRRRIYEEAHATVIEVSQDGHNWYHVAEFKHTPEAERVYPDAIWWNRCERCAEVYRGDNGCTECCDHGGIDRGPNPIACLICGKEWD